MESTVADGDLAIAGVVVADVQLIFSAQKRQTGAFPLPHAGTEYNVV